MNRKWIALILAIALCLSSGAAKAAAQEDQAQAVQRVPCAAQAFDPAALKGFLNYQMDEETGQWSAGADAFEAVLDNAKRSGVSEACVMQFKWMGNARTGLIQPVLELYYFGGSEVKAGAISIRVGDLRYDVQIKSEEVKVGGRRAERMWAPLTKGGMALVEALNGADAYSLRLHGKRTRSTDVTRGYKGTDARKKLESASFECMGTQSAAPMAGYQLWDLNAAAWQAAHEFTPRVDVVALTQLKGFDMLSPGNSGDKVKALQKQLIEQWFLSGGADSSYGERLRDAVLRAQQHYGLMQTGSADSQLMNCLAGEAAPGSDDPAQEAPLAALGTVSLRIDRYWFAHTVEPSEPSPGGRQAHAAGNLDNVLAVFEGAIRNDGVAALSLDWQLKGTLLLDGYPYGCAFLCERDRGSAFDAQLLPQAQSRLIVTAEIPRAALDARQMSLVLEQDGQTLSFDLMNMQ